MTKAYPSIAALACATAMTGAMTAATPAAAADPRTPQELLAVCRSDALACTSFMLDLEIMALLDKQPPYACMLRRDYAAPDVFGPERIAALTAWMSAHPDPAAPVEEYGRRALLAVFPSTDACLAAEAGGE